MYSRWPLNRRYSRSLPSRKLFGRIPSATTTLGIALRADLLRHSSGRPSRPPFHVGAVTLKAGKRSYHFIVRLLVQCACRRSSNSATRSRRSLIQDRHELIAVLNQQPGLLRWRYDSLSGLRSTLPSIVVIEVLGPNGSWVDISCLADRGLRRRAAPVRFAQRLAEQASRLRRARMTAQVTIDEGDRRPWSTPGAFHRHFPRDCPN